MKHFIQTDLTLKYGSAPRFAEAMATIVPFLASHGWTVAGRAVAHRLGILRRTHTASRRNRSKTAPGSRWPAE